MADAVSIRKPSSIFNQLKEMQDQIMRRAYEIFERNGSMAGRDLDNWTQAERELVWKPAFELCERDGQFQLEVALAGMDSKNINIEVTPEDIVVTATSNQHDHSEPRGIVHYCEFQSGRMFRAIHLPKTIDTDKVKAEFKNGLLRLTAPIAEARSRTIKPEAA